MQSCDKYWSTAKNDPNVKKACAVLFDENCCKASSKMKTRTSRAMGALRLMKTCCTFFVALSCIDNTIAVAVRLIQFCGVELK